MKLLSFITLTAMLSLSACSHHHKSCDKHGDKVACAKDQKCKDNKECKDGSCDKKTAVKKDCCATADHCKKS